MDITHSGAPQTSQILGSSPDFLLALDIFYHCSCFTHNMGVELPALQAAVRAWTSHCLAAYRGRW